MKAKNLSFGLVAKNAPVGWMWELEEDPKGYLKCSRCGLSSLDRVMINKTMPAWKCLEDARGLSHQICLECVAIALNQLHASDERVAKLNAPKAPYYIHNTTPDRQVISKSDYTWCDKCEIRCETREINNNCREVVCKNCNDRRLVYNTVDVNNKKRPFIDNHPARVCINCDSDARVNIRQNVTDVFFICHGCNATWSARKEQF